MNQIANELNKWLTHGHEGAAFDQERLVKIADIVGKHPNTIKNLVKGKTKRPCPVTLDRIIKFLSIYG